MVVKARIKDIGFKERLNIVKSWVYDAFKKSRVEEKELSSPETKLRELLVKLHVIMKSIDEDLSKNVLLTRQQRKSFWSDFFKYGRFREDMFKGLLEKQEIKDILEDYKCDQLKK